MGQLLYGSPAEAFEIDDRALAHLQVVIVNKFRRNESFAMSLDIEAVDGGSSPDRAARESMWMHPAIQVRFRFAEAAKPAINRYWCEALMTEANSGRGLSLVAEPEPAGAATRSTDPARPRVAA